MADATNGGLGARAAGATGTGTADSSSSSNDLRERPIGELVKDLSSQTSTLVRKEIELARAELQQQGKSAGKGVGMLGGAAVAGVLMLGALSATLITLLDDAMATWVAA